ncbi:MAG TPA: redoxin domain-containing protein [Planctomycetota bacterium]
MTRPRSPAPPARLGLAAGLVLAAGACGRPAPTPAESEARLRGPLEEAAAELDARTTNVGRLVPDLAFRTLDGARKKLSDFAGQPLVIAVRDVGCPVSQRTAPVLARTEEEFRARGVAFLFLNLSPHNTPEEIRADAAAHGFDGPNVHDPEQGLGAALGAVTTTEVFLLDGARTLVYRGAIDDQVGRGVQRAGRRHAYLADALEQTLARQRVLVAATSAPGCLLGIEAAPPMESAAPTYHREVARILRDNCVECHRTGGVAPFALESHAQAKGRKAMVRLVVEDGIMPPWFAADDTGPWANDRRLSEADKATLLAWIEAGAPEGDARETPLAYAYPDGWRIGTPDLVFRMREPYLVPAEGLVEQRYFEVTPEVAEDLWIQRLEVRPGARQVVHHVTVSYQAPLEPRRALRSALLPFGDSPNTGWTFLFGYLPGKGPRSYPDGIARFLPKGARLRFDMHYTPSGTAVEDQTSFGIVLAKGPPELVAESRNFWNVDIAIPPLASDVTFTKEYPIQHDVLLRSLTPHMHLRGKSMVAELFRPDGTQERLIDIPAWDQDWQFNHVFRTPRFAPGGSRVRVTATYDNSPANPVNPDPHAWVKDGPLTTDEMMSLVVEWIRPRLRE